MGSIGVFGSGFEISGGDTGVDRGAGHAMVAFRVARSVAVVKLGGDEGAGGASWVGLRLKLPNWRAPPTAP